MALLVTGGLGYIGSHACVALAAAGRRQLVVVDNLSNSKASVLERIRELSPQRRLNLCAPTCAIEPRWKK
jgi:UDP-glucose 4-epimerase